MGEAQRGSGRSHPGGRLDMMAHRFLDAVRSADLVARRGRVRKISRAFIEADGPSVPIGALCAIQLQPQAKSGEPQTALAEVVGLEPDRVVLAPLADGISTYFGAEVRALAQADLAPVGD